MSDSNNNSTKLLVIALILAVTAGLAYFMLSEKAEDKEGAAPTETATEQPAPVAEQPAAEIPAAEKPPIVVETKTLALPAAAGEPKIPVAEASKDPAVEAMMTVRKLGSDSAPVKVVEYSSLTCGHCASFHSADLPAIQKDYIDSGKVQFIFKEFPLNKPAIDASLLLRCVPEDRYLNFMSLLFSEQEKWAYSKDYLAALKQNAKLAGLSDAQVESCLANKELENRIIGDMRAASDVYKIQSTPTFIVNDGAKIIVGHQPVAFFKETFDSFLSGNAPAPDAAPATTPEAVTPVVPAAPAVSEEVKKEDVKE